MKKGSDEIVEEQQNKLSKNSKIVIAVLFALLILSVGALLFRIVYLNLTVDKSASVAVPNSLIGEDPTASTPDSDSNSYNSSANTEKATVIELYRGQTTDNEEFKVANMLPGDTKTKYFAVKVSHHADVAVYFNTEITEQTKALGEVLHIKVTHLENEKVLYDGTFADLNEDGYSELFATTHSTETVAYYKIEVSLPTSVGNEHGQAKLMADFNWYVLDRDALDSPETGDTSNIVLWFVLILSSLAMMIILLFFRRKIEEVKNAE